MEILNNVLSKYGLNKTTSGQPQGQSSQSFFQQISNPQYWVNLFNTFLSNIVKLILLSILFFLLYKFGKGIVTRISNNLQSSQTSNNRAKTMATLSQNIFFYVLAFIYIYMALSILGAPVGTLITGAGIFSLALGLGAQGFVSDVVTGFFILVEQQFDVGDSVQISDEVSGTVTYIGLRTTQIRSSDGTLNYVPNREIKIVKNLSRGNMMTVIDLQLFPRTNIRRVKEIVDQVNAKLAPNNADLVAPPKVIGPTEVHAGVLYFEIQLSTKNGAQLIVKRDFLGAYLTALRNAGVELPENNLDLTK